MLPENGFVFCCFNNNYKIVPEIFDIWMRLSRRLVAASLWLLDGSADASSNLRSEAKNAASIHPAWYLPRV
jgi:predicted O-linked N-acetylglucosamine transferase (SPINDLY family)